MGYTQKNITDSLGRTFGTLRVSLTNSCNLRCMYCVDPTSTKVVRRRMDEALSPDQLVRTIGALHKITPFHTIRITGGEPTLFKGLISLIENVRKLGIANIRMTSNGNLLSPMIKDLANAGLTHVNISLDAVSPKEFEQMTGGKHPEKVIAAVEKSLMAGLQVKVNSVILKGMNDNQVLPLFDFANSLNVTLRYLELMKMGHLYSHDFERYFYSQEDILEVISAREQLFVQERIPGSTANYWTTKRGHRFGIIANETSPFCSDCDRLRLDISGKIYGCISDEVGLPVVGLIENDELLREILVKALQKKQALNFIGSKVSMMDIGG